MSALAIVGAVTVGLLCTAVIVVALEMLRETVRAVRQSCRVARYLYGKRWRSKMRDARYRRAFRQQVRHNWAGGEFRIDSIVFPADPSRPLRRSWSD